MIKVHTGLTEAKWLDIRKGVITATEVATLVKLDKWSKVSDILSEKSDPSFTGNSYTWVGSRLEPIVVDAVNDRLGSSFKLFDNEEGKTIYIDESIRLGATPDATDSKMLLECKTTGVRNWYKWGHFPPLKYLCQLQVQMHCCGYNRGYLAVLSTNLQQSSRDLTLKLSIYKVAKSVSFIKIATNAVVRFWEDPAKYTVSKQESDYAKLELVKCFNPI